MLTIRTSAEPYGTPGQRALIVSLNLDYQESSFFSNLCTQYAIDFSLLLQDAKFSAKNGAFFVYTTLIDDTIKTFVFVGYSLEQHSTTSLETIGVQWSCYKIYSTLQDNVCIFSAA